MTCTFPGCSKPLKCNGLCDGHRKRLERGFKLRPLHAHLQGPVCQVPECSRKPSALNLCAFHYAMVKSAMLAGEDDRVCCVPGCKIIYYAKNLCWAHYTANYNMNRYASIVDKLREYK